MTVWVLHPVKEDLTGALAFGEIEYVHTGGYVHADELEDGNKFGFGSIPQLIVDKMWKASRSYSPTRDFILMVGDHLQLMQFTAIMMTNLQGDFDVLRYDRIAQGYYPVKIKHMRP